LYLAGNYGICGYSNPLFASSDFDLRNLLQLKILDLKDNQFENLPNGLSKLQNLEILQLTNNHLNSDSCLRLITKLQDLQKLDLSSNGITKLPDTFSNMQSLKTIIIANRYCEGVPVDDGFDKFPSVFCKMPNLTEIVIPGHRIEKIPKEISNLVNLNTLILSDNAIHRKFPEEFLQLDKIESIELYVYCVGETHKYCEEPFIIDPRICKLKNLKSLSFTGHPDTLVIAKIKNCLPDLQIYYDAW
jgi:Leucine-rich repeat (LRR) protein